MWGLKKKLRVFDGLSDTDVEKSVTCASNSEVEVCWTCWSTLKTSEGRVTCGCFSALLTVSAYLQREHTKQETPRACDLLIRSRDLLKAAQN